MLARQDGDAIFGVGRPLADETDISPVWPIENMLVYHKRLKERVYSY